MAGLEESSDETQNIIKNSTLVNKIWVMVRNIYGKRQMTQIQHLERDGGMVSDVNEFTNSLAGSFSRLKIHHGVISEIFHQQSPGLWWHSLLDNKAKDLFITEVLLGVYNNIWDGCDFSAEWREVTIIPINLLVGKPSSRETLRHHLNASQKKSHFLAGRKPC